MDRQGVEVQRIKDQIALVKAQRDDLVTQANRQIAKLNGAIEALESLIQDEEHLEPEEQSE